MQIRSLQQFAQNKLILCAVLLHNANVTMHSHTSRLKLSCNWVSWSKVLCNTLQTLWISKQLQNSQLCKNGFTQQPIKSLLTCQVMMSNYSSCSANWTNWFQFNNQAQVVLQQQMLKLLGGVWSSNISISINALITTFLILPESRDEITQPITGNTTRPEWYHRVKKTLEHNEARKRYDLLHLNRFELLPVTVKLHGNDVLCFIQFATCI